MLAFLLSLVTVLFQLLASTVISTCEKDGSGSQWRDFSKLECPRDHMKKDPTTWKLPYVGLENQNVGSLCLCSPLGPLHLVSFTFAAATLIMTDALCGEDTHPLDYSCLQHECF